MGLQDKFGDDVNEDRWILVDTVIRGFKRMYPRHWEIFLAQVDAERTEYGLAKEGDLKKASFRASATFPTVERMKTQLEIEADPLSEDNTTVEVSLYDLLIEVLPGLAERDLPGSPNKLFRAFLKRYPMFNPADKL
jgi:hypothetical protein